MTEVTQIKYRRRKLNIVWHFQKDCAQYPIDEFVEEYLKGSLEHQMICVYVNELEQKTRQKTNLVSRHVFISYVFAY